MPSTTTFLLFSVTTLALLAVPGPSVAFVVARTLQHGRSAGLVSMLGLETGALLHVVAAAVGLSALLASSPAALTVVRYAGATYLVALGLRQFRRRAVSLGSEAPVGPDSRAWLFLGGVVVDLLNPKTALFFLAFLPQFVDPARGPAWVQVLALGLCFVGLAILTDGAYALLASGLRRQLTSSTSRRRRVDRSTGGLYVGLGALAVVA